MRPHRRQPTRLPHPWDSPGKNTGVGCHFLLQCMKVKSESEDAQSSPTFSDPMNCSLPGFSVHGIFQAQVLEWVAIARSLPSTPTHPPNAQQTLPSSWHYQRPKSSNLAWSQGHLETQLTPQSPRAFRPKLPSEGLGPRLQLGLPSIFCLVSLATVPVFPDDTSLITPDSGSVSGIASYQFFRSERAS